MVCFVRLCSRRGRRVVGAGRPVVEWPPPPLVRGWLMGLLGWLGGWRVFIYIGKQEGFIRDRTRSGDNTDFTR